MELRKGVPAQTGVAHEKPTTSGCPKLRTSERTRREKLGFLDERPSFKPQIIQQVPDFSRLHKALQTEGLRKSQSKDVIKCQPFNLRTSALPARRSRTSAESSQVKPLLTIGACKNSFTSFISLVALMHLFIIYLVLVKCNDFICFHFKTFLLSAVVFTTFKTHHV